MSDLTVRPARPDERRAAAAALATAFREDPVTRWVSPRAASDEPMFAAKLRWLHQAPGSVEVAVDDDDQVVGAAVWDPPGHREPVVARLIAAPVIASILRGGLRRGARVDAVCDAHRPERPHHYLAYLGAVRGGRGIGSALLRYRLDALDASGETAYLESSHERNLPLYERYGFAVTERFAGPGGMPPLWGMLREPQVAGEHPAAP